MIRITAQVGIQESELVFSFIRSSGPGGQNVNKVATAAVLRFNVNASASLSAEIKARLHTLFVNKINSQGELIIKADRYRTQERNRLDALQRFKAIISVALFKRRKRKPTKPTYASVEKRLQEKKRHSKIKTARTKKNYE